MKERVIVQELRDFIDKKNASCPIALMAGMRRVGKTTVLKQLQEQYPEATYIDFSENEDNALELLEECMVNPRSLLLLDEITFLPAYERISQDLYNSLGGSVEWKGKVVATGSSPAHICTLANGKLGGGRAELIYLPPITFVEYLYFTNRIESYNDYDNVTLKDFKDYLTLRGLDNELALSFDKKYFLNFYETNERSNDASRSNRSIAKLEKQDLLDMANLLAYQLANSPGYDTIRRPDIGEQELTKLLSVKERRAIPLSDTMIAKSSSSRKGEVHEENARLILFLLESRLANIQTTFIGGADREVSTSLLSNELKAATKHRDMVAIFEQVAIALNSPLLYTRLGEDILRTAGIDINKLFTSEKNDLLGQMLEVYIRGALSQYGYPLLKFSSIKLDFEGVGEVDVFNKEYSILCEVTAGKKPLDKINVTEYYKDIPCIRICTTQSHEDFINGFHRIPYAKLCCMIDTKDILKLEKSVSDITTSNVFTD